MPKAVIVSVGENSYGHPAQETLDRIKKLVTDRTSRQIEFVEKVDPAIIGGFVLRVNSMQLDYSVGGELKKIAKQLK